MALFFATLPQWNRQKQSSWFNSGEGTNIYVTYLNMDGLSNWRRWTFYVSLFRCFLMNGFFKGRAGGGRFKFWNTWIWWFFTLYRGTGRSLLNHNDDGIHESSEKKMSSKIWHFHVLGISWGEYTHHLPILFFVFKIVSTQDAWGALNGNSHSFSNLLGYFSRVKWINTNKYKWIHMNIIHEFDEVLYIWIYKRMNFH